MKLYAFQRDGVAWLDAHDGRGVLGDDMGLGKSCQAITYARIHPELRPVLVVCPASLKLNWEREIEKWAPGSTVVVVSGRKSSMLPPADFYVINYDILAEEMKIDTGRRNRKGKPIIQRVFKDTSWIFRLADKGVKLIVADECQAISNQSVIRTRALVAFKRSSAARFIALSGTPIKNKPSEFFTVLNLLAPQAFPNHWKYMFRYCNPKHNGFGWTFDGLTNGEELHRRVKELMLRRLKCDVLKDLPPKRKIVVPLALDEAEARNYETASAEFHAWLADHVEAGLEAQKNIDRLKQLAYIAKRNAVVEWIESFLDTGNKLVVGTYHVNAMHDLYQHFKSRAVRIDGSVTGVERQAAVDRFQSDDKVRVIFCQLLTVAGLTLTAASATCTVEFSWAPADHEQFEDRVHRIGQEADSVTAYYLVASGTVEDDIMALINTKNDMLGQVLDGRARGDLFEDSFLKGLLAAVRRPS